MRRNKGGPGDGISPQDSTAVARREDAGQALAHVYARATMAEAMQAKTLTQDEARRIAANIARLPELLARGQT